MILRGETYLNAFSVDIIRVHQLSLVTKFTVLKASRLSQKLHNWLGILVGVQLFVWAMSGVFMVWISIHTIHGDHLVNQDTPSLDLTNTQPIQYTELLAELSARYPKAIRISLLNVAGQEMVKVEERYRTSMYNRLTGNKVPSLDEQGAKRVADYLYSGAPVERQAQLITSNPPSEIGYATLPVWRVDFDDYWGSSFYISPTTGELISKRHTLWRVFDVMWMLHIMDYEERTDVTNNILRVVSTLSLLLVLTGFWYLYFKLKADGRFLPRARSDQQ